MSIKKYFKIKGARTKFLIFFVILFQFFFAENIQVSAQLENYEENRTSFVISEADFDLAKYFLFSEYGKSSWYGKKFHNRKTASGERYNMYEFTAAHKSLPFGTIVRVNNLENDKSFIVRVNDRGPFIKSRIIDLSYSVAIETNSIGTPAVKIEALKSSTSDIIEKIPNSKYFFCYSFNLPLASLPEGTLKKLASSNDFDESVNLYKKFYELYPNKKIYLAVESDYLTQKKVTTSYYICHYDPSDFKQAYPIAENITK